MWGGSSLFLRHSLLFCPLFDAHKRPAAEQVEGFELLRVRPPFLIVLHGVI